MRLDGLVAKALAGDFFALRAKGLFSISPSEETFSEITFTIMI